MTKEEAMQTTDDKMLFEAMKADPALLQDSEVRSHFNKITYEISWHPSRNPAKSMTPISTTTSEKRTRKHVSNTVCTAFKRCFFDA